MTLLIDSYARLAYEGNPLAENGNLNSTARGRFTIPGLFDNESTVVNVGGQDIMAARPQFETYTAALAHIAEADTIEIRGTDYTIVDIEHDGTGATVLHLQEA